MEKIMGKEQRPPAAVVVRTVSFINALCQTVSSWKELLGFEDQESSLTLL